MSKAIVIQESGVGENLTVDALRLKKFDGGTEDWVPADGRDLVELQIGGSGTYKASDYNAYGIAVARVTPKVGGGATAKAVEHDFTEKHTPSIKEGGKSRNFSAAMLKTNLQGGGTCLWVPRIDVELKSKYITKSGTYAAKADDCFGFDQVTVSGVDVEITQDEDGDDVADVTDGGVTTREKLPSEIRIVHEPNFTGPYGDGAYIGFDGLVVHGYSASGVDLGEIPFNELVFPVTVTDISQAGGEGERDVSGTDLTAPVFIKPLAVGMLFDNLVVIEDSGVVYGFCMEGVNYEFAVASYLPGYIIVARDDGSYPVLIKADTEFNYGGKTCFTGYAGAMSFQPRSSVAFSAHQSIGAEAAAGIALLGTTALGGGQRVPVQWNRPYDGQLLETSFNVEVVDVWTVINDEN